MTKKTTKKKQAKFSLEPDGFSIHTFELSQKVSKVEYKRLKAKLYDMEGTMYKDDTGNHVCRYYEKHGVRLYLEGILKEETELYFLRLIINPRKLIDRSASYLGIFSPTAASNIQLEEDFEDLFEHTPLDNDINNYKLSRLDFCTNIRCDSKKVFSEMIRVLRKLPTPAKYERIYHKEKDKKKENKYNKHYIKFACCTHSLVIYDKTYQTEEEGLSMDCDKMEGGVIRFEVQCNRSYLQQQKKERSSLDTIDFIMDLTENSREIITKHFAVCFDDVKFIHIDEGIQRISRSKFNAKNKEQQEALMKGLQRKQSVDMALAKLSLSEKEKKMLLKSFKKLGFSPIPLRENFTGEFLIGPVSMLKMIGEEDVVVGFVETKWR